MARKRCNPGAKLSVKEERDRKKPLKKKKKEYADGKTLIIVKPGNRRQMNAKT